MSEDNGQSRVTSDFDPGPEGDPVGQEGKVDVRRASTGLLLYNLILCTSSLQQNSAVLMQMKDALRQQKIVGVPLQVEMLQKTVDEQTRARDIMVKNLEDRFRGVDEVYWARLGIVFTPSPQERA